MPEPPSSRARKGLAHSSLARQSSPPRHKSVLLRPSCNTNPGSSRLVVPLVRCRPTLATRLRFSTRRLSQCPSPQQL
eukprot:1570496-Rhodomonas_salina.1